MRNSRRLQRCRQGFLQHGLSEKTRLRSYCRSSVGKHLVSIQPPHKRTQLEILGQEGQKGRFVSSNGFLSEPAHNFQIGKFPLSSIKSQIRNLSTMNNDKTSSSAIEVDYMSVSSVLEQQVQERILKEDKAQKKLAKRLSRLQQALVGYDNAILFAKEQEEEEEDDNQHEKAYVDEKENDKHGDDETKKEKVEEVPQPKVKLQIPRGLYIHGPVGTGKTMLMDAFFENAPISALDQHNEPKKKRYHFHAFLAQVHERIHQLKQQDLDQHGRNFHVDTSISNNPIHRVGLEWSQQVSLLCLDEFQVTDIADALILSQLFGVLFRHGTVVVATSNRPPQDLYEGGLNRSYFLPFIDLLQHHCITHTIKSPVDYRKVLSDRTSFFLTGNNINEEDSKTTIDTMIQALVGEEGSKESVIPTSMTLPVGFRRTLEVPLFYTKLNETTGAVPLQVARFPFDELCDRELGAMDYRAIAHNFQVVILEDVPVMDLEGHNVARRFITLIDELYEGDCALLCSTLENGTATSIETPMDLFSGASETHAEQAIVEEEEDDEDEQSVLMGVDVAQEGGMPVGALASVRELAFAFERSASRMFEMTSRPWWDRVLGLDPK